MEGYLKRVLMRSLDRRDFLKYVGILSTTLIAPPGFAAFKKEKFNKKLHKVERTLPLMGTFVTITVMDPSLDRAEEAIEAGFAEVKRLSHIFNRFASSSYVSELNAKGNLVDVPPEMKTVIDRVFYYYRLTDGAFDVTVKPLVDLLKYSFVTTGHPPTPEKVKEVLALIGGNQISYKNGQISFLKEGMGITLDGIAKGYIVDKTAELIVKKGIKYVLVNAGGDIRGIGDKSWKIAIRDPFMPDAYIETITLKNNAIATSGNYEVYFDKEKLYTHIVNPHTGCCPARSSSVSILARTTMDADALSTTVFILHPVAGKNFIDRLPNVEGLVVTRDGFKIYSQGWNKYV